MTITEFRNELKSRGFDGFDVGDLDRYINFGYRMVGRLTRWKWEEADITKTLAPGAYRLSLATDLPTVRTITAVAITTLNYEKRLDGISDTEFYDSYMAENLALTQNRSEPYKYFMGGGYLYVLPPPQASRDILITAQQWLAELTDGNPTPITPEEYDEAILLAAEEQCHLRARQPSFAEANRRLLQDFFDDALSEETSRMSDRVERVIAGRRTL